MAATVAALLHTGILGVTGTGKTHWVLEAIKNEPRVLYVDVNDETSRSSPTRRGPLLEAMTPEELKRYPMKLFEKRLSLAIVGLDPFKPQRTASIVKFIARAQAHYKSVQKRSPPRLLLVLGEMSRYARHCTDVIEGLTSVGGQHLNVTVWGEAQRPMMIPKSMRSQFKRLIIFHLEEPSDVEAVEERTHSPGLSAKILALPNEWTPNHAGPNFIEWPIAAPALSPAHGVSEVSAGGTAPAGPHKPGSSGSTPEPATPPAVQPQSTQKAEVVS